MVIIEINKSALEKQAIAQYHLKASHRIDSILSGNEEIEFEPTESDKSQMIKKYGVDQFSQAMELARQYHLSRFEEEQLDDDTDGREILEIPSVESSVEEWIDENLIFGSEPRNKPQFEIRM
jgi:hypothetical protein